YGAFVVPECHHAHNRHTSGRPVGRSQSKSARLPVRHPYREPTLMQRALSFTRSPPLSVPLRFFLNAPLFALLAAVLLLWAGPEALQSRWTPYTLALTHLLTLGVLGSAMAGAMMQILPVATGIHVLKPRLTAVVVHALLTAGTVA